MHAHALQQDVTLKIVHHIMTAHNLITPPPPPSLISKAKRNWIKTKKRCDRKQQARLEAALAGARAAGGAGAPDTATTAATHMQQDNDAMMHEMGEGGPARPLFGDVTAEK